MSKHRKKKRTEGKAISKPTTQEPSTRGLADASQLGAIQREWGEAFALSSNRSSRYEHFDRMDTGHIASMLNAIILTALTFEGNDSPTDDILMINNAFKVQIGGYASSGPTQVIRQIINDTNLRSVLRPVLRDTLKFGDSFIEPLTDSNGNLVRLFHHNTKDIIVNRDKKGNLETGTRDGHPLAYQQRNSTGTVIAGWYPWEFIHVKYWPDEKTYSEFSFLDPYRQTWDRLNWIEQSAVVARITRSFLRLIWKVDLTGKSAEEGKKLMRNFASAITRRDTPSGTRHATPLSPDEDYFLSLGYRTGPDNKLYEMLNGAQVVDPSNAGLANIKDIEHFQNALFDRVPAEMLGIQGQRSQDLTGQEILFSSLIKSIQQEVLEAQLVRPVLNMGLLLKGYKDIKFKVIWPHPSGSANWKLADAQFRLGLGSRTWVEMKGASRRFMLKRIYNLSDDQVDAVLREVEEEEKRFGPLDPADVSGQMAVGNTSSGLDRDGSIDEIKELLRLTK